MLGLVVAMLVACNEYEVVGDPDIYGTPNPPDLSVPVQTDRIVQVPRASVDVLWLMDNSCSMQEEQDSVSTNFPKFMNYFLGSGLDYHVGVISTDMDDPDHRGKLRTRGGARWIDPTTADPITTFGQMVGLGTDGAVDEKGRAAIYTGLETQKDAYNSGFLRDDAFLSIVVISDENDYSGSSPVTQSDFKNWLLDEVKGGAANRLAFSSIVGPRGGCTGAGGAAEWGEKYLDVTAAVGGIEWSICDPAWDTVLEELGTQAAGLKREFFLSQVPVEDSLAVWVEEEGERSDYAEGTDWTYDRSRNSVRFAAFVPSPLAEVYISYELLSGWQLPSDDADAP